MSEIHSLRIWCNYDFLPSEAHLLREGMAAHRLTFARSDSGGLTDPEALEADILLGQPDPALLLTSARLRWAEITSAGYTPYDRVDLRMALQARDAKLTNASHVFDEACAQHLAAMMLALARELPRCLDNQRGLRAWLHDEPRAGRRFLLNGQTVFLYGFGTIARRLVEIIAPWQLQVFGVRRRLRGDEGIPMLSEPEADARLGEAHHVVNLLPDNGSTPRFFGAERFGRFRPGARFYNIGRGATVDQDALLVALRENRLESAYLDVTDPEPLPTDHPLWTAPRCFITPHIAGTHDDESTRLVQHFLHNLRAFEAGKPLSDRVI